MGIYIPPNETTTTRLDVLWLWTAWQACPDDCVLLVFKDLIINFEHPWDEHEEVIANLLNEINLTDSSHKFLLWR
jgi:hypothetical protein